MSEIIQIERMSYGSAAIGHMSSGKVAFVEGAAPGDLAEVEITEEKSSYAKGRVLSLKRASRERAKDWQKIAQDPAMQAMAPWAHLSYEAQLSAKYANVKSALIRNAHLQTSEVDEILKPAVCPNQQWGYRNKIELAQSSGNTGRIRLGVHAHESGQFIETALSPLGNSLLHKAPRAIQGALRYLFGTEACDIYRVGVRASEATKSLEIALWTSPGAFPRAFASKVLIDATGATSIVRVIADRGSARKVKKVEVLAGEGAWQEKLGFKFHVSAPSFFQVNTSGAQMLISLVLESLNERIDLSRARVADLYSGVGTFSIPLAGAGAEVSAIELEGSSSRDFRENVRLNKLEDKAEIICDDVARSLPSIGKLDACVVDPPRAGLDKRVISQLAQTGAGVIVYVSCDPQTLSRDIDWFAHQGYTPASVTPLDMFAQTYHVENVCVLVK